MPLIDNAVYRDGIRVATPASLELTFEAMKEHQGMGWMGLYRPSPEELESVAKEFGLHHLAIEDALAGHQRAKIERYGDCLFVVLRPARYVDETEVVEFGELHVFIGPDYVITVRHAESPDVGNVRQRLEANPALLAQGPEAVLYALLDQVVDEYLPVVLGLENDIDEIEDQLFGDSTDVSRRIYALSREVLEFQRATKPLVAMLESLERGAEKYNVNIELQRNLRDVGDHAESIVQHADSFRQLLQNALTVHLTQVGQRQNDEMKRLSEVQLAQGEEVKKISSWAAIIFAPTFVAGIYGMNFDSMPELHWQYGYPMALLMMLGFAGALYAIFKRKNWL
jgi:magnesium transporter